MNNNFRWGGIILLLVGAIGCGTSGTPQGNADGQHADQDAPQWKSVTLHFDGFKKTKSGST